MVRLLRRRCLAAGCRTLIRHGSYCAAHQPYQGDWRPLSTQILRRDDYVCRCKGCSSCAGGYPCERIADTVDHIDGNAHHSDPSNLRAMCRSCNTAKGGIA